MKPLRLGATVIACVILSACAIGAKTPDYASMAPTEIAQMVAVSKTKFDAEATVVGPKWVGKLPDSGFMNPGFMIWLVRGWTGKSDDAPAQLYVDLDYTDSGWRFYNSASFVGGDTVNIANISKTVDDCDQYGSCSYDEVVGVPLTLDQLKQAGPLSVRLNAKSGADLEIDVPASYVHGFLQAYQSAAQQPRKEKTPH